jgi:glutathione S-transferase
MSFQLIGSHTSPFVRKIRLLLINEPINLKNLEFTAVNYLEEAGNKLLREKSPFNQLPVLLDGDQPIFESRVMYNYIAQKYNLKPMSIDEENILSAIDACLSSAINLFSLEKGGIDIQSGTNYFIERQRDRLPSLLNYITPWTIQQQPKTNWNFLTMSLYSSLVWMEFRKIYDLKNHPEMKSFLARFKNCPGVHETEIPGV